MIKMSLLHAILKDHIPSMNLGTSGIECFEWYLYILFHLMETRGLKFSYIQARWRKSQESKVQDIDAQYIPV
jgi:hypothetical protein